MLAYMGQHILKYIHTHIGKYTYKYSHIYIYIYISIKYILQKMRNMIYVYIYLWQDNDQFISKVKHIITNKEESFSRKGLASVIANTVNIMKKCYNRITNTTSKDTTAGQLTQQT